MKNIHTKSKIIFLSTYPPTQCGIATYTQDTIKGIHAVYGNTIHCEICELLDKPSSKSVQSFSLFTKEKEDYTRVAHEINKDAAVKLIHIQHEFGLFGGNYGNYLLDFLNTNTKPVAFTFHSVIPNPNEELKAFVKLLVSFSKSIFVMTRQSEKILINDYGIQKEIISCVPHGTHIVIYQNPLQAKEKFNIQDRKVLSTFGLLGEGKNIETGLYALPEIIKNTPEVLYLIIGKTHPNNSIDGVDVYRKKLEAIVNDLHLEHHVRFINEYLNTEELLDYLKATDIYLFTSKDPNQAVSGTFSYAMSCACPIVASKIPHTLEVLTTDCGILVDIGEADQFAKATIKLLSNDVLREEMGINSFRKTRASSWENAAIAHINSYKNLIKNPSEIKFSYPPIRLAHMKRMTTTLGIIQFSKISAPDLSSGYTLDDNARALVAFCLHYKQTYDKSDLAYIRIYLDFIERCQKPDGDFINYVDEHNIEHLEQNAEVNLEDSNARAIWALGTLLSNDSILPDALVNKASACFIKSLKWVETIQSPRSIGFATKGLYLHNSVHPNLYISVIIDKLNAKLVANYKIHSSKNWKWFENYLTYANCILPESLLYAYLVTHNPIYKKIALESFDFLLSKMFTPTGFKVISNDGWYHKDSKPQQFGEQPIDVSYTIQTLNTFYNAFKIPVYKVYMKMAFEWFLGKNHLNQIMYNPISGGGYDGLEKENVNLNQGAESTICFLTARLLMEDFKSTEGKVMDMIKIKKNLITTTESKI